MSGGISQGPPELLHRRGQTVLEVYKGVAGPKSLSEFLSRHHFPGPLEQYRQHLKGLFLELYLHPLLAQFTGLKINGECREANPVGVT
jgi:hypothetical protein